MKRIPPKDTLTRLWFRLGINQAPLVRAPRRATDNERGICTYMNMNMAVWLENIQGFDPSQFDEEYYSQITLKQFICQGAYNPNGSYSFAPYFGMIPGFFPPNATWTNNDYTFTSMQNFGIGLGAYMTAAMQQQYPYPTPDFSESMFFDLNNTGYIDEMDAAAWTTCIGYYGCS